FPCFEKMFYFPEKPRITNTGPPDHCAIQTVFITHFHCFFRSVNIAIPKDWNVHSWVVLYLGNWLPIRISLIHLRPSAAMNGQRLAAYILQAFGNFHNPYGIVVPAQA